MISFMSNHTWKIEQIKKINYEIIKSDYIFNEKNKSLLMDLKSQYNARFVVIDSEVDEIYGQDLRNYFDFYNINAHIFSVYSGEKNKTIEQFLKIFQELDNFPINRKSEPVIAIGGGVITDVVGFVASCYRRGVPHIKVPTTLMGYIDAAVGIKTGINFNGNKNRMGSFEPPKAVILDRTFLKTQSKRHIINGYGEILKLAIIKDATLFSQLEDRGVSCLNNKFQNRDGGNILDRVITGMINELVPNLYEDNLERSVDFGHTFSPILEMRFQDTLLHGEGVAIDVLISSLLAKERDLISHAELNRIIKLIKIMDLNIDFRGVSADILWNGLLERSYHRDGMQRMPLPHKIGGCIFVNDILHTELKKACEKIKKII